MRALTNFAEYAVCASAVQVVGDLCRSMDELFDPYADEIMLALLSDLASGLKAIVSQRLLRSTAGGRVPAVEVLLNTQLVSEMVERGDFTGVKEAIEKSLAEGSQSYEQDIARLITEGIVTRDEGLGFCLLYTYTNDPDSNQPALHIHRGTCELRFADSCSEGSGIYFNDQHRLTFGRMKLTKRVPCKKTKES